MDQPVSYTHLDVYKRQDKISGRLTAVASLVALRDHICSLTFNIRYPITMKAVSYTHLDVYKRQARSKRP